MATNELGPLPPSFVCPHSFVSSGLPRMTAEDAALGGAVTKLGAGAPGRGTEASEAGVDLRGQQHAGDGRREVDPAGGPDPAGPGGREGARRIDAHAGK